MRRTQSYLIDIGDPGHRRSGTIRRGGEMPGELAPVGTHTSDDATNAFRHCSADHPFTTATVDALTVMRPGGVELPTAYER